jgi:phage shock protein A
MSLISRIMSQITGKVNDAVDSLEDAGSVARQSVREISDDINKAEEARVGALAEYNSLIFKRDQANTKVAEYQGYAEQAVAAGDDQLATDALTDQATAQSKADEYQAQVDKFKPTIDSIAAKINELKKRRDAMQNQTSMIEARDAVAEARINVANVVSGLGNGESAGKTFARIEEKTAHKEAEAAAREQIATENTPVDASEKYAKLKNPQSDVAAKLAAMKAAAAK